MLKLWTLILFLKPSVVAERKIEPVQTVAAYQTFADCEAAGARQMSDDAWAEKFACSPRGK